MDGRCWGVGGRGVGGGKSDDWHLSPAFIRVPTDLIGTPPLDTQNPRES